MRQFILATGVGAEAGKVNLVKVATDAATQTKDLIYNLVLNRAVADGGNILYPFYPKDFTLVKAAYSGATQFVAKFEIADVDPYLDYTFIFMKKGFQFNERAKWTATVHTTPTDTPATVVAKIKKYIDNNPTLGLTATVEGAAITFKGSAKGEDYNILASDEIMGLQPTEVTNGKPVFMDAEMVKDLAAKCAADAGFEYTYGEGETMYPNFLKNPLAQPDKADTGFTVYTLRFTEPRVMATRDDAVYQIIQVAFPTGADTGFADLFANFLGGADATAVNEDEIDGE